MSFRNFRKKIRYTSQFLLGNQRIKKTSELSDKNIQRGQEAGQLIKTIGFVSRNPELEAVGQLVQTTFDLSKAAKDDNPDEVINAFTDLGTGPIIDVFAQEDASKIRKITDHRIVQVSKDLYKNRKKTKDIPRRVGENGAGLKPLDYETKHPEHDKEIDNHQYNEGEIENQSLDLENKIVEDINLVQKEPSTLEMFKNQISKININDIIEFLLRNQESLYRLNRADRNEVLDISLDILGNELENQLI